MEEHGGSAYGCNFDLRSLAQEAVEAALEQGAWLQDWDQDIGVFEASHLSNALSPPPDPKLGSSSRVVANKRKGAKRYAHPHGQTSTWSAVPALEAGSVGPQRTIQRRGKNSSKKFKEEHGNRRGGVALREAQGDTHVARLMRLLKTWLRTSQAYSSSSFSIEADALHTSTGWHGMPPPKAFRQHVVRDYLSGAIDRTVAQFFLVPFFEKASALLFDRDRRVFFFRTPRAEWLCSKADVFHSAVLQLLEATLVDAKVQETNRHNARGPHFPCIIGHYRQYAKKPLLTLWHRKNADKVADFLANPLIQDINTWVCRVVQLVFPGVASRFEQSSKWHSEEFPGQLRVHCLPHVDSKNVVGVCALLVYEVPGAQFDHATRTWLVLWEAGVVIQLPPWVVAVYPSSLLFHFNIDIADFQFVVTDGGEHPTRTNSRPIHGGTEGRGSLVYFNEASMYQCSETGYSTLARAKSNGHSGSTDYGSDVKQAFTDFGSLVDARALAPPM